MAIQTYKMGRSRLSLGGGGLNSARKLSAVAVVALLIVPMMLMFSGVLIGDDQVQAEDDGAREITYHDPVTGSSMTVTYYGTAVAEYNPEYWSGNLVGDGSANQWTGPSTTISHELRIDWDGVTLVESRNVTYTLPELISSWSLVSIDGGELESEPNSKTITIVRDKGWASYSSGTLVLSVNVEINKVFGGWKSSTDDAEIIDPGKELSLDVEHLYVNWITPDLFFFHENGAWHLDAGGDSNVDHSDAIRTYGSIDDGTAAYQDGRSGPSMYSTRYDVDTTLDTPSLSTGTYRSISGNGTIVVSVFHDPWIGDDYYDISSISGDVVIDNIRLRGSEGNSSSHGTEGSMYANGNLLIIGTGVECGLTSNGAGVQINGGWNSGNHGSSADARATDVRIFSGTFSNVFGGSYGGSIKGIANVTILGGRVTDTVYGGSYDGSVTMTNVLVLGG